MIGYVAKDKNGTVYLYRFKPTYDDNLECWFSGLDMIDITGKFPEFDSMSYKDEPVKVEIKLKKI